MPYLPPPPPGFSLPPMPLRTLAREVAALLGAVVIGLVLTLAAVALAGPV